MSISNMNKKMNSNLNLNKFNSLINQASNAIMCDSNCQKQKEAEKLKKPIIAGLDSIAQVFVVNKKAEYIFGNTFSLLDAAILPLLWRLSHYDIEIKPSWSGMMKYAEHFFTSPEFVASLTPAERVMRL